MNKVKHIGLIDFFEVIADGIYGKTSMGKIVESELGLSREAYMEKDNGPSWGEHRRLCRGLITEREYWEGLIKAGNWDVTPEQLAWATDQAVKHPVPGTTDVLRELKAQGCTLILVSDLWEELKNRILLNYPWINSLFDKRHYSYEYGMVKSDPLFFKKILEQEKVNPDECFFVDDYYVNVEMAQKAGITGIVFEDAIQLKRELVKLDYDL